MSRYRSPASPELVSMAVLVVKAGAPLRATADHIGTGTRRLKRECARHGVPTRSKGRPAKGREPVRVDEAFLLAGLTPTAPRPLPGCECSSPVPYVAARGVKRCRFCLRIIEGRCT